MLPLHRDALQELVALYGRSDLIREIDRIAKKHRELAAAPDAFRFPRDDKEATTLT